jgi:hypothetical protein
VCLRIICTGIYKKVFENLSIKDEAPWLAYFLPSHY